MAYRTLSMALANRLGPFVSLSPSSMAVRSLSTSSRVEGVAQVGCRVQKAEGNTPINFTHFGCLQVPGSDSFLTISKSDIFEARVSPADTPSLPPKVEFSSVAYRPTTSDGKKISLNQNSRLYSLGPSNQIYAFGGSTFRKNNLHLFHLQPPPAEEPGVGWLATEAARLSTPLQHFIQLSFGNRLFVLGESYYDEINDFPCSLHVYDATSDSWSTPPTEGEPPSERTKLMIFAHNHSLMVLSPNLSSAYDLFILDTETMQWRTQQTTVAKDVTPPYVRTDGTVTVMGNRAVLYGGLQFGQFLNEVAVLDLETYCWMNVSMNGEAVKRYGHVALALSDSRLLAFGGNTPVVGNDFEMDVFDFE